MSTYSLDKDSSKVTVSLDEKIKLLMKTKEHIEKEEIKNQNINSITKEDLYKLNFSDELTQLKSIHREKLMEELSSLLNHKIKEIEKKDQVLSELTASLDEKIKQLESANFQLQQEKKHSDELNANLKSALKKLSEAEMQLKIERDWLADQVEKKSLEVLNTIDQLIKAENAKR
jgi:hypothetical protein